MNNRIMLIGGPDSGKTNFLARLWQKLKAGDGSLYAPKPPSDIRYVEDLLAHLLQGEFAPRTEPDSDNATREFSVSVAPVGSNEVSDLIVPDVSGELWRDAVETTELPAQWMDQLRQASGALLFIRVHSKLNVEPLNWVTSHKLLTHSANNQEKETPGMPTQVVLCELLRFLEVALGADTDKPPRVGIVITAWDLLDSETAAAGPAAHLRSEFPLFAGRLIDTSLEVRIFGVSILGGDLADQKFRSGYLKSDPATAGYVVYEAGTGVLERGDDVAFPVAWVTESTVSE